MQCYFEVIRYTHNLKSSYSILQKVIKVLRPKVFFIFLDEIKEIDNIKEKVLHDILLSISENILQISIL